VAVDVSDAALQRAGDLGAEAVVHAGRHDDVAEVVRALTGGGAHVSLDALGSPATAAASVESLRRRGRHVQVGLLLGPAATPPLPMDRVVAHELEIYGSHGMAAHEYPAMLALVEDGTLRPDRLVGDVIGLDQAGDALAAMDRPAASAGMTVVRLPG
jgi:alcohol dehydrogenase